MHPGPTLVSSGDTSDREHRGDRKEEGTQSQGNRKTKGETQGETEMVGLQIRDLEGQLLI